MMTEAYVLGGVRTPFTRYGGTLSGIRTDELLGMTMKGACERVGVPLDAVEDIVAGCVNPAHEGMGDIARWAALAAGFPDTVAGATSTDFADHRSARRSASAMRSKPATWAWGSPAESSRCLGRGGR